MRTLLLELRPAALAETSLPDLLRQLGEAVVGRARIPVEVQIEDTVSAPPEVAVALYRIAQEALNNVVKHAAAGQATVTLHDATDDGRDGLELVVADDGCGFAVAACAPAASASASWPSAPSRSARGSTCARRPGRAPSCESSGRRDVAALASWPGRPSPHGQLRRLPVWRARSRVRGRSVMSARKLGIPGGEPWTPRRQSSRHNAWCDRPDARDGRPVRGTGSPWRSSPPVSCCRPPGA